MIQVDKDVKRYSSLEDLVAGVKKDLYLRNPCQENRDFGTVFLKISYEAAGYLDTNNEEVKEVLDNLRKEHQQEEKKKKKKKKTTSSSDGKKTGEKTGRKKKKKKTSSEEGGKKEKKPKKKSTTAKKTAAK